MFICLKEGVSSVQCSMHLKKVCPLCSAVVSARYGLLGRGFSTLVPSIAVISGDHIVVIWVEGGWDGSESILDLG